MSHITAAIENALCAGRWLDAAPLLSDLLADGHTADLRSLEHYEQTAGSRCNSDKVRRILTQRLSLVENRMSARRVRNARQLASVVREHGFPCRVVADGRELRVACRMVRSDGSSKWEISSVEATVSAVRAYLGYGDAE